MPAAERQQPPQPLYPSSADDRLADFIETFESRLDAIESRIAEIHAAVVTDPLMTPAEAAVYCGVSEWTLNMARGEKNTARLGPEFIQQQRGGRVHYRRSALDAWNKQRERR